MERKALLLCLVVLLIASLACSTLMPGSAEPTERPMLPTRTPKKANPPPLIPTQELMETPEDDSGGMDFPDDGGWFGLIPTGQPVDEWRDVPIMPAATSGAESDDQTYTYAVPLGVEQVNAFYVKELPERGWASFAEGDNSGEGDFVILFYVKDDDMATISVYSPDGEITLVTIIRR